VSAGVVHSNGSSSGLGLGVVKALVAKNMRVVAVALDEARLALAAMPDSEIRGYDFGRQ